MKLPKDLIAFVNSSDKANDWFAGLGEDYQHPTHIININRRYSNRRTKRKTGKWERDLPKNFIIINRAFDNDCDCIDLNSYNKKTGEYKICYWHPNMSIYEIENSMKNGHTSFIEYINSYILSWCNSFINDKKNNGEIRERSKEKAEKFLKILQSK